MKQRARALVALTLLLACSRDRRSTGGDHQIPSDSSPDTSSQAQSEPQRSIPPFCSPARDLYSLLRTAPPLRPTNSPYLRSPDDFGDPGPLGVCAFPRPLELTLHQRYVQIAFDSGPSVFLVGQSPIGPDQAVFALRVPGMYDPDRIDLYVYDSSGRHLGEPLQVAEAWGDAGEVVWVRSWLVDVDRDGYLDVVRHSCTTVDDMESDSSTVRIYRDNLETIRWTGQAFAPPEPVRDSALKQRYATGAHSCLPN